MILNGIAWYCIVLYGIALYRYDTILSYQIIRYCMVLHGIALYHCWLRRAGCISQESLCISPVQLRCIKFSSFDVRWIRLGRRWRLAVGGRQRFQKLKADGALVSMLTCLLSFLFCIFLFAVELIWRRKYSTKHLSSHSNIFNSLQ